MACHIRLALLFLLVIFSQAKLPCRVVIHNIYKLLQSTVDFHEYCGCNGRLRRKDLPSLQSRNNYEIVKGRVAHTHPPDRPYFCDWRNESESSFVIFVRPILVVRDFKCHIHQQLTCTFRRSGDERFQLQNKYTLKLDNEPPVPCALASGPVPFINEMMQCNIAKKPSNWRNNEHIFQITMTDAVYQQTDEIKMGKKLKIVRPWSLKNVKFNLFTDHICLDWFQAPEYIEIFQINIRFIPLNSMIPQVEYVHEGAPDSENGCFNIKLHPYQTYNVRLLVDLGNGIEFSENYDAGNVTSVATAPRCPPQVLTNGFFYDPGRRQLHIFWLPLNELDANGPKLRYSVYKDIESSPQITRHNSMVFIDWNPDQLATLTIWSENSEGRSANSSQLEIPTLTSSKERQPQNVRYHVANFTITWRPPKQQNQLIGYTVLWCSASRNRKLICDDTDLSQMKSLEQSQHELQFNDSVMGTNIAVACLYEDEPSGGLTWIDTTVMPFTHNNLFGPVLALILVAPVVFGLIFIFIRRIRVMSKIEVVLPEFLLISMKISSKNFVKEAPVAVPGNFSPKVVLNQVLSSIEEDVQLNTKTGISGTILECQDSNLYIFSSTENETGEEESSSLKGLDLPKDLKTKNVTSLY